MTDEQRARLSEAHRGRAISESTKAKLRAARLANNPMKGTTHTEEAKAKMRAARARQGTGAESPSWRGGRTFDKNGYVLIYQPTHPSAIGNYVPEHRLIMEGILGRLLATHEHVHHLNEVKDDNRPENLSVMTKSEHSRLHRIKSPHLPNLR